MNYEAEHNALTGAAGPAAGSLPSFITWRYTHLLAGLGIAGAIFLLVVIAITTPVAAEFGSDSPESYAAAAVASLLWNAGFVFTTYQVVLRTGGDWASLGLRSLRAGIGPAKFAGIAIGGYVAAYLTVLVYTALVELFGLEFLESPSQLPSDLFDHTAVVVLMGIAVMIAAPIAEEVLFRGFLFGGLRRYWGFVPAALVSGAVFSLAHGYIGLIIPFMLVGAVLAFVYERSGSLLTAIATHFIFNAVSYLLLVFFPEFRETDAAIGLIAQSLQYR